MENQSKVIAVVEKPGGVLVTISGLSEPVVLPIDLVYRYNLKAGVTITPAQADQLVAESQNYLCDREAARLLALREHTAGEMRLKLRRKGFADKLVAATVAKYVRQGLIDDARLAATLARQAMERKPAGRPFLVALLRRKMIERTLAELTADTVLDEVDEVATAVRALRQRWPTADQIEVESIRSRAYSYLSRRGFGYETARAACNEVFGVTGKADED